MKKNISLIVALLFSVGVWILIGYFLFHLMGCASKPNWKNHPYDPNQKIDLTLVPEIIP
jgi:hypothetical protein